MGKIIKIISPTDGTNLFINKDTGSIVRYSAESKRGGSENITEGNNKQADKERGDRKKGTRGGEVPEPKKEKEDEEFQESKQEAKSSVEDFEKGGRNSNENFLNDW